MRIHFLSQLGEAFGRLGFVSDGLAMVEEGFADLELTDERVSEAELHRSRGLLHLAGDGESAAAEACFRRGIEVARSQQALLLELRAATALAELLVADGRAAEARALLEDVTGRFTQGQGTAVFQDASRLLERISAGSRR
jgi:ATP/maltotriose-dependent transcriptional regulator MalT